MTRRLLAVVAVACLSLGSLAAPAGAGIVLFTASTDNTGGGFPVSVPGTNNPNIPNIDPGVTVNPNPAFLDGNITYGPFGFGGNAGGNTGWVHVSYTTPTAGDYQLIWEVAGADYKVGSALAFDNVQVNGTTIYGFEGGIPGGFTTGGTSGTSGSLVVTDSMNNSLPNFDPTEGSSFGFIDISNPLANVAPIYDTVDGYTGSHLFSGSFHLNAGDTISMDLAFLTNEGAPFVDYGIATLRSVPEPSSIVLTGIGLLGVAWAGRKRRPSSR